MAGLPHLPLLRGGRPYRSLETQLVRDVRTGQPVVEVSQASPGLVARDLRDAGAWRRGLAARSTAELIAVAARAAELFANADLRLGESFSQSPDQYLAQLSATTGLPRTLVAANRDKVVRSLAGMETYLAGLTRGLDAAILDQGYGEQAGRRLSYVPATDSLGAVLPNNSPGVHTLWLPALPLKVPLVLKPGSTEPWTPYRLAAAFRAAGAPPEAMSLYPGDHSTGIQVLLSTGRSMIFGDQSTVERWSKDPRVQPHGPGWSKLLLGPDQAPRFAEHLDLVAASITSNGGRSCINASGVWTSSHGRELAAALAERLAGIAARALDDPAAELAAFTDGRVARRISELIDSQLAQGGAVDLTAEIRGSGRVAEAGGCTFLLPTVIWCEDPSHALAQAEFGFPFVTVVELPPARIWETLGPTLVGTVLSDDPGFRAGALGCAAIDRLNLGAIPTHHLAWDQPHEGNLFEHLYRQRAFQAA